jgi:hypothetical protein
MVLAFCKVARICGGLESIEGQGKPSQCMHGQHSYIVIRGLAAILEDLRLYGRLVCAVP